MIDVISFLPYAVWIVYILLIIISVTFSLTVLRLIRKKLGKHALANHHTVAGYVYNAIGVVYAVLIAFVIYVTWTEYNLTVGYVQKEATAIQHLFLLSEELPEPERTQVWGELRNYLKIEIEKEWKAMSSLKSYTGAQNSLDNIHKTILHTKNSPSNNTLIIPEALTQIKLIKEYRQEILNSNKTQVPHILWVTIILMSAMFVGFIYFFWVDSLFVQSCLTALLTIITTTMLYLIIMLDSPFTGETKISEISLVRIYHSTSNPPIMRNTSEQSTTGKMLSGSVSQ